MATQKAEQVAILPERGEAVTITAHLGDGRTPGEIGNAIQPSIGIT